MRHPQLLIYESDRRLAAALLPLADKNKWLLREPRQLSACLRLLQRGGPGVLLLRLSRDRERELALVEQVSWLHPDTAIVLIVDDDAASLSGLAWDLGARWILPPPHSRERVADIVVSLMQKYQPIESATKGGA